MKNKLRLSLIDDYIKLTCISKLCINASIDNGINKNIINSTARLLLAYEKIFFKFNFMDDSLAILNRELKSDNFVRECKYEPSYYLSEIEKIKQKFFLYLQKLPLNEVEKSYVASNLNV